MSGGAGGSSSGRVGGALSPETTDSPWVRPGGHWPLPWLEAPWRQAVSQRGHALLLHGPHGVGQFELALSLAQTWLCEAPRAAAAVDLQPPCGRCDACHLLQAGVHPDVMILVPDALRHQLGLQVVGEEGSDATGGGGKPKAGGRDIRVADVRRAIDWGHQSSSRGRAKVLILHPAQALNVVAANALLKTLEEPAGLLRLVLSAADPQALLPTLRSRCQAVAVSLPPAEQAQAWLTARGVTGADMLLRAAAGRPQEAWALVQEGLDARRWPELPELLRQGRVEAIQGLPIPRAVDVLQKLCLDLMTRAMGQSPQYFPTECLPAGAQPSALSRWWRMLQRVARHDEHPWNAPLLLESLVLAGRQCWPARDPHAGAARRIARTP